MRAYVYRNLRTGGYSVMVAGKVVSRKAQVCLTDVEFRVRPGGRDRVTKEKQKNVHAFAVGTVVKDVPCVLSPDMVRVTYNPYENETFTRVDTKEPVLKAAKVVLNAQGCFAIF